MKRFLRKMLHPRTALTNWLDAKAIHRAAKIYEEIITDDFAISGICNPAALPTFKPSWGNHTWLDDLVFEYSQMELDSAVNFREYALREAYEEKAEREGTEAA